MQTIRQRWWQMAAAAIVVALVFVGGQQPTSSGPLRVEAQPAPTLSIAFGPDEIWIPSSDAVQALHGCQRQLVSCIIPIMQQDGASDDAVAFYRLTGWFLTGMVDYGTVQVGTILNPWRANENSQIALLGGVPAVVYTEQDRPSPFRIEDDPAYADLAAQYPQLAVWPSGPAYEGVYAADDGGMRFVFRYYLVNGCHACGIGWDARVAFDFAPDGTFERARFIDLEQHS